VSAADVIYGFAVAMGITGLAIDSAVQLMPDPHTAGFFEVRGITGERNDGEVSLFVDRTIHHQIHMEASVRVMERSGNGWREYCQAQGPVTLYLPDNVLDQPVTLGWWTWGQCPDAPSPTKIVTTWAPVSGGLDPVSYEVVVE
jgi:hypothetical protein